MRKAPLQFGFALIITLVLMAFIVVVVVAFLANTRVDRSTSSVYAGRVRAKMIADSGLSGATELLKENTKYGNYITAMPAPTAAGSTAAPTPITTELYRPVHPSPSPSPAVADYLRLDNAVGDVLVSRVVGSPSPSPSPQIDPRPTPETITSTTTFSVSDPALIEEQLPPSVSPTPVGNSYNFNQLVRVAGSNSGRLVQPSGSASSAAPALGQWVRVRNSVGDLVGRYAFFIEDESMKVNVNATGNNLGPTTSPNLRLNDLSALPTATPASQIQELDPAAILVAAPPPDRAKAITQLAALGATGARLSSSATLPLLPEWGSAPGPTPAVNYLHLVTVHSTDDDTTARGWKRLDLNKLVADAEVVGTPAAKKAAATTIADWIRDAWTGTPTITNLQDYQIFGEDWLRKQVAANIVDYIDTDNIPTDMGNILPPGYTNAVPVIGIEKHPYLAAVEVIFESSDSTYPGSGVGVFTATVRMRLRFRFINLFDSTLDLATAMGTGPRSRFEVVGVPIISKNGIPVYDISTQPFPIKLSELTPVNGSGTDVPPGVDGTSNSGARSFQSPWLSPLSVPFTVRSAAEQSPRLLAGKITIRSFGNKTGAISDDYRIDDTEIVTSLITTGYRNSSGSSVGDFLKEQNNTSTGPLQIASINLAYGYGGAAPAGDPRYRGRLVNDRWNNTSRSDATGSTSRVESFADKAEINPRAYGLDWADQSGNRPLAVIRDAAMLSIGELGNVATCEYPWRTLYLQYPERPSNTNQPGPATEIPLRRSNSVDYAALDLFRTNSAVTRVGAININTQQRFGNTQQHALSPLFLGERVGTVPSLTQTMVDRACTDTTAPALAAILDRRVSVGPPPDNTPARPFFQAGELASVISRFVNTSAAGTGTTGSPGRTTVTYSLLRNTAAATGEAPTNANIQRDTQVEQLFRGVSNAITTRGNVFRVLYVGQSIKDTNHNGLVDKEAEIAAEYLGEAFVRRDAVFTANRTTDSNYTVIANRAITE